MKFNEQPNFPRLLLRHRRRQNWLRKLRVVFLVRHFLLSVLVVGLMIRNED